MQSLPEIPQGETILVEGTPNEVQALEAQHIVTPVANTNGNLLAGVSAKPIIKSKDAFTEVGKKLGSGGESMAYEVKLSDYPGQQFVALTKKTGVNAPSVSSYEKLISLVVILMSFLIMVTRLLVVNRMQYLNAWQVI